MLNHERLGIWIWRREELEFLELKLEAWCGHAGENEAYGASAHGIWRGHRLWPRLWPRLRVDLISIDGHVHVASERGTVGTRRTKTAPSSLITPINKHS